MCSIVKFVLFGWEKMCIAQIPINYLSITNQIGKVKDLLEDMTRRKKNHAHDLLLLAKDTFTSTLHWTTKNKTILLIIRWKNGKT